MQIVSIRSIFKVLTYDRGEKLIFPVAACSMEVSQGVVTINHPCGQFSLPIDKFERHIKDGNIVLNR